tara:strand:+ start:950 stop:1345 length:396 start_codon:yes stop_codon:yes gene_type:complete
MLLGHGAIGQFGVAEALPGFVVNAGTVDVSMGQAATFSIGTEIVTGSAVFAVTTAGAPSFSLGTETVTAGATVTTTTAGAITVSVGDETAFGEAFQNLISFTAGSPDLQIWNQADDSQSVTWVNVEPGSTD